MTDCHFFLRRVYVYLFLVLGPSPMFANETSEGKHIAPPLFQTEVKGLLITTLPDGSHAGTASQMNATVVPAKKGGTFDIRFNQKVGEQMAAATKEVAKFIRVRHRDCLPVGNVIELGFANKYSLKDGPSAAVASALMANAIILGKPLDETFAATGDLTATGDVRPVGGIDAKVSGATREECRLMTVPEDNKVAISDLYVSDGLEAICRIQVLTTATFDQAWELAVEEKSIEVAQALNDFDLVSKAVLKNVKNARHPKVREKLRSILKVLPNHESARLVALHGSGRGPKRLSLRGSLLEINRAGNELGDLLANGEFRSIGVDDKLWQNLSRLQKIRNVADRRSYPYLDAIVALGTFVEHRKERKILNSGEYDQFKGLFRAIDQEKKTLLNNKEISEELLKE